MLVTGQEEEEDRTGGETIYDSAVETNKALTELYLDSEYYSETCLKIQPVVDSIEDREKVLYKENTRNVDYQSSFFRQVLINIFAKNVRTFIACFTSVLIEIKYSAKATVKI